MTCGPDYPAASLAPVDRRAEAVRQEGLPGASRAGLLSPAVRFFLGPSCSACKKGAIVDGSADDDELEVSWCQVERGQQ